MFIFLLNILFSQIVGDDNLSRVILANKISKYQTIFLDEFKDFFLGDIIERNGHYVSSKSPGISFSLSLISYLIDKLIPNNEALTFIKENFGFRKLSISNLPISINIQSLIALILFSALPGSLLILFLEKYTKNIYISMLIYLASPLSPYSTTLFPYIFSIFLITFAFIIRHKILTPIILGLSVFFEFTSIFLAFIVLFYLRRKVNVYYFLIGVFPSIIYFLTFHNVFAYLFRLSNIDYYFFILKPTSWYKSSLNPFAIISAIIYDLLKNSIFVLFSLYRGIFIYFPLLIIFFIYYRNFSADIRKIALYSFAIYLIFNSLINHWWGSLSFGPRYMIFSIPFIILSISSNWKVISKRIFYALVLLSIFINGSSFTYWEGARKVIIEGKVVYITGIYKKGELIFEDENKLALTFPLLQHYLSSLIENGPRSKLIESLFTDRPLDLRYLLPEDRDYFLCVYGFPPYLSALILLLLFLIFFWNEIKNRKILLSLILIAILSIVLYNLYYFGMFDSFKKVNKIELKFGFYPKDSSGNIFVYKRGVLYIFSNQTKEKVISLILSSFIEDRNITLLLNGRIIGNYNVSSKYDTRIAFLYPIKDGKNELRIISNNCVRPIELNISDDKRCLSLFFKSIDISDLKNGSFVFLDGWYQKEKEDDYQWGSDLLKIAYISLEDTSVTFYFDILPVYNETTIVEFYLNGELKNIFEIARGGGWVYTLPQKINKGINYLEFKVPRGCVVVDDLLHNGDKRCIAMTLRGVRVEK